MKTTPQEIINILLEIFNKSNYSIHFENCDISLEDKKFIIKGITPSNEDKQI